MLLKELKRGWELLKKAFQKDRNPLRSSPVAAGSPRLGSSFCMADSSLPPDLSAAGTFLQVKLKCASPCFIDTQTSSSHRAPKGSLRFLPYIWDSRVPRSGFRKGFKFSILFCTWPKGSLNSLIPSFPSLQASPNNRNLIQFHWLIRLSWYTPRGHGVPPPPSPSPARAKLHEALRLEGHLPLLHCNL